MDFPIYKTKVDGVTKKFDLSSPLGRHEYFHAKVGKEIEDLKEFLDTNTFLAFLLAKKQAGKGTYSKMLQEVLGSNRIKSLSVGDLVRNTHKAFTEDLPEKTAILKYLKSHYRGYFSLEEAIDALLNRSTEKLSIPNEFLITLIQREIESSPKQSILLDGFPRTPDQVSYSLYLRSIMNFRDDPDLFILIDIPRSVIDARMKGRVVCPICQTSRNIALLPTSTIKYDDGFKLLCDNPECKGHGKQILIAKEGDHLGVKAIENRLKDDGKLIEIASSLHGIPKITIRNHIPADKKNLFDDYEMTPKYSYELNKKEGEKGKIIVKESAWTIKDDKGIKSYSLLAPPAIIGLIKQLHEILV